MSQFPITKTADHTTAVGNLLAAQDESNNYLFPTYLVTSDAAAIGASNALHVQPGTGASWAVTGPLTDTQLRASAVPVSLASIPLGTDAATATKQDSQTTYLATLAGAVSGTEVQVDVVSLPTVTIQDGGGSITVDGTVAVSGSVAVTNAGTFAVQAAQSGTWSVEVASSALPTGAATSAKQDTIITSLSSIDGHVDGIEGSLTSIDAKIAACNTGAVVVASSALPTGAATAARQDTGNASLSSIDAKTPALGQALAAASVPVVLTAAQLSTLTPLATVAATQSGTWNVGTVTTVSTVTNLSQLGGVAVAMGTGTRSAGTQRVTIATDDVVPVSQSGTWNVGLNAGTNNIGDVDVLSQPARAATTDTITAKLATDCIQNGTTALTPKYAKISASSSGNNTVVAAVTSKKIRVLGWNLVGNGAVNAKWQDGAGGTDLTGLYYVAAAGGGICVPFNPVGWFETSSNTLLNLNLSGAVAVGGSLCYVEV